MGENGQVWEQNRSLPREWDAPPSSWKAGERYADNEGLLVPQGTPPGEYTVHLAVTDALTEEPLRVSGELQARLLTVSVVEPASAPVLYGLPNPNAAVFCSPEAACLTLAGYEPGGTRFEQGYPLPLTLHWMVPQAMSAPPVLRLRIMHRPWLPWLRATPVATATLPLVGGNSTATLPAERLLTVLTSLSIPVDAPASRAQVVLEVLGADGVLWKTASGATQTALFPVTIEGRPVQQRLSAGLTPIEVDFGTEVGLRGYRIEGDARPGGQIRVVPVHRMRALTLPRSIRCSITCWRRMARLLRS